MALPFGETPGSITVPPIGIGETLYHRVPPAWYQPGKTKRIPQRAFMPRPWQSEDKPGDVDGLSVNRASFISVEDAAVQPHNKKKAHLVQFNVADVYKLRLTVAPKPTSTDPSHAVIPELNSLDMRDPAKKAKMDEWAITLRDGATLIFEAPTNQ
jgi:hypothetical protein